MRLQIIVNNLLIDHDTWETIVIIRCNYDIEKNKEYLAMPEVKRV